MPKQAKVTTLIALAALAVLAFTLFMFNRDAADSRYQSTDDAYIRADFTLVSPQISGQISQVAVAENQTVKQGDLLFRIDSRDFDIQVENGQAGLALAEASRDSARAQALRQGSVIAQARAQLEADRATLALAELEHKRYRNLSSMGATSKQTSQQAETEYRVALASLATSQARFASETQQMDILQAEERKAEAAVEQARAGLDLARLNLSYCTVSAPIAGVISQQSARLGARVQTGTPLLAVVPVQDLYIEAYFRETQLANIKPGQPAAIRVDAFPGRVFKGRVAGLGPASNASFSSIAPHSTSSNFTKIAQRLPVRILIEDVGTEYLRVGMSVIPQVDTR